MPPPPTLASLTGWGGGEERHTPNRTGVRSMATNRKAIDAKNARRLKIQQKKKKNKVRERELASERGRAKNLPSGRRVGGGGVGEADGAVL